MNHKNRFDRVYLIILAILALILRLDFLIPVNFVLDADEAIVGLMAKHIKEGYPIPTFYYGQHYMGSFEPILVSISFKFFGVSALSLKLIPLIFSLALIFIIYMIGKEVGGAWCARSAALFTALPASSLVVWSGKARGGFIEILFLGACALLFTLKWLRENEPRYFRTFIIAFTLGFGWWTNNQIIFFILPIGFFMLGKILWINTIDLFTKFKIMITHAFMGISAFLLGGAPFWIYNFNHGFISFEMFGGADKKDLVKHLTGLISTSLPIIIGAKRFWNYEDIFPYSSIIGFTLFGILFLVVILCRFSDILRLSIFKISSYCQLELFIMFILGTLAVFSLSSFGYLTQAPRYLLPLYIGIYIIAGKAVEYISIKSKSLALAFIFSVVSFNLASCYVNGRAIPGEPFVFHQQRVERDHTELINWLNARSIKMVRTNYWIGYKLAFETNESIKFSLFQEPPQVRIKEYERLAEREGREHIPLVLVSAQLPLVEEGLKAFGISYSVEDVGGYKVVFDIKTHEHPFRMVKSDLMEVSANLNNDLSRGAIDGDIDTRWGSGTKQVPGMTYSINFKEPLNLTGIRYHLGKWTHDYPRKLRIELVLLDDQRKIILDEINNEGVKYLSYGNPEWSIYLDPVMAKGVVLTQLGEGDIFDWSIGELDVLEAT